MPVSERQPNPCPSLGSWALSVNVVAFERRPSRPMACRVGLCSWLGGCRIQQQLGCRPDLGPGRQVLVEASSPACYLRGAWSSCRPVTCLPIVGLRDYDCRPPFRVWALTAGPGVALLALRLAPGRYPAWSSCRHVACQPVVGLLTACRRLECGPWILELNDAVWPAPQYLATPAQSRSVHSTLAASAGGDGCTCAPLKAQPLGCSGCPSAKFKR